LAHGDLSALDEPAADDDDANALSENDDDDDSRVATSVAEAAAAAASLAASAAQSPLSPHAQRLAHVESLIVAQLRHLRADLVGARQAELEFDVGEALFARQEIARKHRERMGRAEEAFLARSSNGNGNSPRKKSKSRSSRRRANDHHSDLDAHALASEEAKEQQAVDEVRRQQHALRRTEDAQLERELGLRPAAVVARSPSSSRGSRARVRGLDAFEDGDEPSLLAELLEGDDEEEDGQFGRRNTKRHQRKEDQRAQQLRQRGATGGGGGGNSRAARIREKLLATSKLSDDANQATLQLQQQQQQQQRRRRGDSDAAEQQLAAQQQQRERALEASAAAWSAGATVARYRREARLEMEARRGRAIEQAWGAATNPNAAATTQRDVNGLQHHHHHAAPSPTHAQMSFDPTASFFNVSHFGGQAHQPFPHHQAPYHVAPPAFAHSMPGHDFGLGPHQHPLQHPQQASLSFRQRFVDPDENSSAGSSRAPSPVNRGLDMSGVYNFMPPPPSSSPLSFAATAPPQHPHHVRGGSFGYDVAFHGGNTFGPPLAAWEQQHHHQQQQPQHHHPQFNVASQRPARPQSAAAARMEATTERLASPRHRPASPRGRGARAQQQVHKHQPQPPFSPSNSFYRAPAMPAAPAPSPPPPSQSFVAGPHEAWHAPDLHTVFGLREVQRALRSARNDGMEPRSPYFH
jgi:hypothetical protein